MQIERSSRGKKLTLVIDLFPHIETSGLDLSNSIT